MNFFSSNYDYDIIIIGGGISGLLTTYKLSKTDLKILLIESQDELGGRIRTVYKTNFYYECGASRFHKKHTKLLSLINELGLKDKIEPLPKKINYFLRNKDSRYYYNTDEKLNLKDLLKEAVEQKKEIKKENLVNITFFQYLMMLYDSETVQYIKDTFGYDSEIMNLNAHAAIKMYKNDILSEDDYYYLSGGLSQIIQKMEEELILKENVIIKRNTQITNIVDNKIIIGNGDKFKYGKLILTIPSEKLKEIEYFKGKVLFDSVKPMKLLRIYVKYPIEKLWFKGIKRTITDNYIRHIIPVNEEEGLLMISYSDGIYAEMWERYNKISETFMVTMLHKEIEKIFGVEPPKPEFLSSHYWENGIHLWDTGYDMDEEYDKMLKPFKDEEIYICGESFSKKQGWIEGSLETTYDVIKSLNIKGYHVEKNMEDVGNLKKRKKKEKKNKGEKEEEKKEYTLKEIDDKNKKAKTWIILDHDGKKGIYDIKNWIPKHPGGGVIMKGIDANEHYKNPDKHSKSPYEIWKTLHNEDILKKYLIKENEWVKHIGYLKI